MGISQSREKSNGLGMWRASFTSHVHPLSIIYTIIRSVLLFSHLFNFLSLGLSLSLSLYVKEQ